MVRERFRGDRHVPSVSPVLVALSDTPPVSSLDIILPDKVQRVYVVSLHSSATTLRAMRVSTRAGPPLAAGAVAQIIKERAAPTR